MTNRASSARVQSPVDTSLAGIAFTATAASFDACTSADTFLLFAATAAFFVEVAAGDLRLRLPPAPPPPPPPLPPPLPPPPPPPLPEEGGGGAIDSIAAVTPAAAACGVIPDAAATAAADNAASVSIGDDTDDDDTGGEAIEAVAADELAEVFIAVAAPVTMPAPVAAANMRGSVAPAPPPAAAVAENTGTDGSGVATGAVRGEDIAAANDASAALTAAAAASRLAFARAVATALLAFVAFTVFVVFEADAAFVVAVLGVAFVARCCATARSDAAAACNAADGLRRRPDDDVVTSSGCGKPDWCGDRDANEDVFDDMDDDAASPPSFCAAAASAAWRTLCGVTASAGRGPSPARADARKAVSVIGSLTMLKARAAKLDRLRGAGGVVDVVDVADDDEEDDDAGSPSEGALADMRAVCLLSFVVCGERGSRTHDPTRNMFCQFANTNSNHPIL
jgi:hypothetical protein